MIDDDPGVATGHWQCDPTFDAVMRTTGLVGAFAGRHGMRSGPGENVALAVSEVLAHVTGAEAVPARSERATVAAAIDGQWLTVTVRGSRALGDDTTARATAHALADRVEWDGAGGDGMTVLMEFPTGARATPQQARRGRRPACAPIGRRARRGH